jgi:hypothetical protein
MQQQPCQGSALPASDSAFRKEFVFFNDRGHGHLPIVANALNPQNAPFALHADAFRQSDLGR